MASTSTVFATKIHRSELDLTLVELGDLTSTCLSLAGDDIAGQAWCRKHGYPGYTSYASLNDLPWRYPAIKALVRVLDRHAGAFAKEVAFDLRGGKLALDDLWVNVLPPGGSHSGHIHPKSVISGTVYVAAPPGSSAIRFEDPRLGLFMAAPPRKKAAPPDLQPFVHETPAPGTLLLWESWLRHEVPVHQGASERISISFNYRWG